MRQLFPSFTALRRAVLLALPLVLAFASAASAWAQSANSARPTSPASSASASPAQDSALPTQATIDSFMKHTFGYDPSIEWKVLSVKPAQAPGVAEVAVALKGSQGTQNMRFYVLPGGEWAMLGDLVPFGADPSARTRAKLATEAHGPARGPADAAVTIVEFSDLQCPSCKAAQPTIDRLLTDLPNARFVFQNFPLENLHPWALRAAGYADCVARANNDAFWKFMHTVYSNQEQVTTENADQKLTEYAQESGVNGSQMAACAAQPATMERIRQSQGLGLALNVTGTPTLFINGRQVSTVTGIPYELLKSLATATPK